jgi:hypothetical protein
MSKLGLVDSDQFDKELHNSRATVFVPKPFDSTVIAKAVIQKSDRGRGNGNKAVPKELQKLIGEESVINGRSKALELAADFGISPSSVSAYSHGATSTATINQPDKTLTNYLQARKSRITKRALAKLTSALDVITPDKLSEMKTRDVAALAKDMSVIAKNMEPPNTGSADNNAPKFVVYAPTIRDERTYETIVVNDAY